MYRLYKKKITGSYDNEIIYRKTFEEIQKEAEKISPNEYYSYLIIENDGEGDRVVTSQELYKEVRIELTDKDETNIKLNIAEISTDGKKIKARKLTRTKKKEELRKLTEGYIDRWDL